MLKCLYTLSQRYRDKKIVVYGVNRTSVNLFTDLAFNHQVNITAFWDIDDKFTEESFINRHIINTKQLQQLDNVIVIIPEACEKQEIQRCAGQGIEIFYKKEVLDLNEELKDKRIYIYGMGIRGENIYDELKRKGIEPEGVCVTKPGRIEQWYGKEVLSVGQIKQGSNCAVIPATDNGRLYEEMLKQLTDFQAEKYISYFRNDYVGGNFFQVINIALSKHKKIWLYNNGDENAQFLKEILRKYQIGIEREIYCEDVYELAYEDIDNISVIVAEIDAYKSEQVCDILDSLGFGLGKLDYTALVCCVYKANIFSKTTKRDILLGNSSFTSEKYPGYVVYGDEEYADVKLMILGGSTSTSNVYRAVSWVDFLYEKLSESGYKPIIYNGAVCAHGIVDEFLHMVRDIEPLQPDYVISLSGYNNTSDRKAINQFNTESGEWIVKYDHDVISGIKSNESQYDFWCRISKLMKLVAEYHGGKVYNFLQPMSVIKEELNFIETGMFDMTEHTGHIREYGIRASMERDRFYINLLSLFEGKKEMYIDMVHYSTEANKLIAECIFEIMKSDIERTVQNKLLRKSMVDERIS